MLRRSLASLAEVQAVMPGSAAIHRTSFDRQFGIASRVLGAGVVAIGSANAIDLLFNVPLLYRLEQPFPAAKLNAALSLCLLGVALLWTTSAYALRRERRALSLFVAVIGGATLFEWLFGVDLGIDQLLIRDHTTSFHPGRMAPSAALNLLLLGLGLLWIDSKRSTSAQIFSLAVVTIAFAPLCGYLYGAVPLLMIGTRAAVALPTTLAFVAGAVSLLLARPSLGMMQVVSSETAAAGLLRRLLPAMLLVPLLVGWLSVKGQQAGAYGLSFAMALVVSCNVALLSGLAWKLVSSIHRSELEQISGMKALRDKEEDLSVTLNSMTDGLIATDTLGRIVRFSPSAERMTGWKQAQALHKPLPEVLHLFNEASGEALSSPVEDVLREDQAIGFAERITLAVRDGSLLPVTGGASPIRDAHGGVRGVAVVFHDASVERAAEQLMADKSRRALRMRDEQLRFVVDGVREHAIFMVDPHGIMTTWSKGAERLTGWTDAEAIGQDIAVFREDTAQREQLARAELQHAVSDGRYEDEGFRVRKDGSRFWAGTSLAALRDGPGELIGFAMVIQDFSARRKVEEDLRQRQERLTEALQEREILLQEVHHRVKNNLQVISSLVNMQARTVHDEQSRDALEQCKARIETIARIHEQLYQSEDYARVPFSEYAKGLTNNIFHAMGVSTERVALKLDIEDARDATLPVDQAIPCGLILNELVTNALKHAFPDRRAGCLDIALRRRDTHTMQLRVSDDGIGMHNAPDPRTSKSLGMLLTNTLVTQLDGTLEITATPGTTFCITFPVGVQA